MIESSSLVTHSPKVRIITKILTSAIKFWLKTQLSQASNLQLEIQASDRQLLSGSIPQVFIAANNAVYQGLHITQLQVSAENIKVNISSVLKGKPLQLLEIVPVVANLIVDQQALNYSLSSQFLVTALNELLNTLLPENSHNSKSVVWEKIHLDNNRLLVYAILTSNTTNTSLTIDCGIQLFNGQTLQLTPIKIREIDNQNQENILIDQDSPHIIHLGTDVDITEITINSQHIVCHTSININP
ncbi:DUF2993 domain-containing protein [Anabaena sp. FACHB-1237]|uniref:LmeA family phospholipid-binding protein n=1 Tax=Anabaena sp. FACHB-1237 TaxID=2692769 RepID=UPI001680613E|nr:DUF2993 domain-containing protein [Anabaena sp. FACHB-1237]MBD2137420.1 DUF2993 domain-containing protein [Anabaena sp. FACHB-1237]